MTTQHITLLNQQLTGLTGVDFTGTPGTIVSVHSGEECLDWWDEVTVDDIIVMVEIEGEECPLPYALGEKGFSINK